MSNIVSYETVAAAAESLAKQDKRQSVRSVIAELGGGSPNAVLPLLNQWKAGRPTVAATEIQIDPRIIQLVGEQIVKAAAEARSEIELRLAEVEADAKSLADAGLQAEEGLKSANSQIQLLTEKTQTQAGQVEQLKSDIESVKIEAAEQIATIQAAARDSITKSAEAAARETAERLAAHVALGKAELRLEALPALTDEIKQLRLALDAERQAKSAAESEKASALAKADGLADRLADTQVAAEKSAIVSAERLVEQGRSCTELVSSLKAEIQILQKQIAEKTEKSETAETK